MMMTMTSRTLLAARRPVTMAASRSRAVRCFADISPVHGSESGPAKQHIKVGSKLPSDIKFGVFKEGSESPVQVGISEILGGKKAVIFGTPGAYTSTCSAKHVPEFNAKADDLMAKGVEVIACVAVNDAFVMREWAKSLNVDTKKIMMLADGDAAFVKSIGLAQSMPGMGDRALRFSAFVNDMEVEHLNIEEPGPTSYKVSGPDHMLGDLEKMKVSKA